MNLVSITGVLYMVYTLYTLYIACVSDYPFLYVFLSLVSIWGVYFSFYFGYYSVGSVLDINGRNPIAKNSQFLFSKIADWSPKRYLLAAGIGWFCSLRATKFYTGKGFMQVVAGLFSEASAYYQYQQYFIESNIATFSLGKIIYILMMVYATVMLLWSLIGIFLLKEHKRWFHYLFCVSNVLSYLYFGLARGTNFELFIIFLSVVYVILRKQNRKDGKKSRNWKKILLMCILGFGFVMVFRRVVMARGIEFTNRVRISPELTLNEDSFFAQVFPMLTNIAVSVFNYMGFGIYTIGASLAEIRIVSIHDLLASLIPYGYPLFFGESFNYYVRELIDVGVRFTPDFNTFTNILGLPLFYVCVGICGRYTAKIRLNSVLLTELVYCLIYIELLSIPVSNFLTVSSFNILTIMIIAVSVIMDRIYIKVI